MRGYGLSNTYISSRFLSCSEFNSVLFHKNLNFLPISQIAVSPSLPLLSMPLSNIETFSERKNCKSVNRHFLTFRRHSVSICFADMFLLEARFSKNTHFSKLVSLTEIRFLRVHRVKESNLPFVWAWKDKFLTERLVNVTFSNYLWKRCLSTDSQPIRREINDRNKHNWTGWNPSTKHS